MNDLQLYEKFASDWWCPRGGIFRSLRGISKFRLELISRWIPDIQNKTLVDLGCGGGLLSAPLSKKGAIVTGVDLSAASLREAKAHSAESAQYIQSDIRHVPLPDKMADVVLLADVLDHLADYPVALAEARRILKPGGYVFINTINRNLVSKLLAVTIAENINLVPKGTHDPSMFIRPSELEEAATNAGFKVIEWQGERPAIAKTVRNWAIHFAPCRNLSVAYSALLMAVE